MMSSHSCTDESQKSRPALGDISNRLRKRDFSLISGNSDIKNKDGSSKNSNPDKEDWESSFARRVSHCVEKLVKDRLNTKSDKDLNDVNSDFLEGSRNKSLQDVMVLGISKNPSDEIKKNSDSLDGVVHCEQGETIPVNIVEEGDLSSENHDPNISMPTAAASLKDFNDVGNNFETVSELLLKDSVHGTLCGLVCDCDQDGKDLELPGNNEVEASKSCVSAECSTVPSSQSSKSFELGRCSGLKVDAEAVVDPLKSCACSFCKKAAQIWSDLYYQDVKAQISAVKKSQKEANSLVQRYCWNGEISDHGQENYSKSKLESELLGQWKLLFLHMEDVLLRENNQLVSLILGPYALLLASIQMHLRVSGLLHQANLITLKDLRGNCKMDPEIMNVMRSKTDQ
ncbi:hypothetical protein RJ641_009945 [Dillenia turbinata]|uniref:Uncharacterized protein n=1 Tax=Dillenia turbinata TaxID=194707 RepID=A0AAN8Z5Z4_9MAGN